MDSLTGFQRDLLVVISGGDRPSGLDIKAELDAYYTAPVNHGRLYPNLDDLVEAGLVEKEEIDARTNGYSLTPRGERAMADRRRWEDDHVADLLDDALPA